MACNKMSFESRKQADATVATIKARNTKSLKSYCNKSLKPYFCKKCEQWHLTSSQALKGKRLAEYKKKKAKKDNIDLE